MTRRDLKTLEECRAVVDLQVTVWGADMETVPAGLLLEAEVCEKGGEVLTFPGQRRARRTHLLDHGSVLLRGLVHLVDGRVDLFEPERLFLRRNAGPARVTIFDGGHEGLPHAACEWLSKQHRKTTATP